MQPSVDDVKYSSSVQVVLVLTGLVDPSAAGRATKLESSSEGLRISEHCSDAQSGVTLTARWIRES